VYSRFGDRKDFAMIGISLDFNEVNMKKALDEYSIKWPQIFDGKGWETEIGTKYGVMAIPRTMLRESSGGGDVAGGRAGVEGALNIVGNG